MSQPGSRLKYLTAITVWWTLVLIHWCWLSIPARAAELSLQLQEGPASGTVIVMLFDDADAFGDFRDAVLTQRFRAADRDEYLITEIPVGEYALVVFVDENENGRLDRNFIGIPREPLGFSNRYRPKGPPSFARARFRLRQTESQELTVGLYRPLGRRGRFGVGAGVIGRSSPYRDSDATVLRPIPALTYIGERVQLLGPQLRIGLAGSGKLRLAASARYRFGAYEDDDSPLLAGLGDREDTLMAGLTVLYEPALGVETALAYEHDVLDRIGGGAARLSGSKSFQLGITRLVPNLALNWQSRELTDHDFGVPTDRATAARPAYRPGSSYSLEAGLGTFIELTRNWRVLANFSIEFLQDEATDSPIVDERHIYGGFAAISYQF